MNLKGKKVLVMGLGLHGGGAAVVKWLVKHGAQVTVTDLKMKKELKASIDKLKNLKLRWVLGQHQVSDFKNHDLIIQNPDVSRDSRYLKIAKTAGVGIENDASLFFKNCRGKIIGLTGTRGKSTTAVLINQLVPKSYLAGLPQKPMLAVLDQIKAGGTAVLELSSWQLEILGQQKLSPDIGVVTNIYPDHLNRYSGMVAYIKAKKNIYRFQDKKDFIILNLDNSETKKMGQEVLAQRFWFSKKYFADQNGTFVKNNKIYFRHQGKTVQLASLSDIKLLGEHNLENILAAITVAAIYKVSVKKITSVLKTFAGLPGRMEFICKVKGVSYINDTTSTIPDATIAALSQLGGKKTILIAGGDFKNIPDQKYKQLAGLIKYRCKAVVLFSGQGSQQLLKQLEFEPLVSQVSNMSKAINIAQNFAQAGDTILLSPACASFNLFINEFDRGDQFVDLVSII